MRGDLYNNWSWLEPATMRTFQKAIYQLKRGTVIHSLQKCPIKKCQQNLYAIHHEKKLWKKQLKVCYGFFYVEQNNKESI